MITVGHTYHVSKNGVSKGTFFQVELLVRNWSILGHLTIFVYNQMFLFSRLGTMQGTSEAQ